VIAGPEPEADKSDSFVERFAVAGKGAEIRI